MPRLTIPYSDGLPIIRLALDGPTGAIAIGGVVDSGADKTLLPLSVADKLGVPSAVLIKTPDGSTGAGGTSFDTWVMVDPLAARVLVQVEPDGEDELWGPDLYLAPDFVDDDDAVALFGREDFFCSYTVTFVQAEGLFHLDYSAASN
jgi:hypothetical protein